MLIYFSEKFQEYIEKGLLSNEDIKSLENIFIADYQKYHLVSGNINTLEKMHTLESISDLTRQRLSQLISSYSTEANFISNIKSKIIIDPYIKEMKHKREGAYKYNNYFIKADIYYIPLNYFKNPLSATNFICENITDCYFYKFLLEKNNKINKYGMKFQLQGGGGNTIAQEIRNSLLSENIVLSVLDSDKDFPTQKKKSSIQTKDIIKSGKRAVVKLVELPCREKENLYSLKMLENISEESELNRKLLGLFNSMNDKGFDHAFLCIKKGIKFNHINVKYYEPIYEEIDRFFLECNLDDIKKGVFIPAFVGLKSYDKFFEPAVTDYLTSEVIRINNSSNRNKEIELSKINKRYSGLSLILEDSVDFQRKFFETITQLMFEYALTS